MLAEAALNALLNFEHRAFLGVAQGYGAEVKVYVQIAVYLLFVDYDGRNRRGYREYLYVVNLDFKPFAAVAGLTFYNFARYLCRGLFDYVFFKAVVRKFRRINALNEFARRAQYDERKVAHIPYVVYRALYAYHLAFVFFEGGVGGGAV